jgi:hypothetical protein
MRLTLTYEGELSASGNSPKPEEKWKIRRFLHPQLAELWQTNAILKRMEKTAHVPVSGSYFTLEEHHSITPVPPPDTSNLKYLFEPIPVAGNHFVPLIRESMALICELDILFLRKEEPGALIKQGGDLDNRIKTLFDGLRMPDKDEMSFAMGPMENPFYCLLQNDSLIAAESVKTGQLLTRPSGSVHEVKLIINVVIKVTHVRTYNLSLLGD